MSYFDIFGHGKNKSKGSKEENSVVNSENLITRCDHTWESHGERTLQSNLAISDAFARFMKEIGGANSYHRINSFKFRICKKCNVVEIKSPYNNLYGPKNWVSPPDYLVQDMVKDDTRIPKITELCDLLKYKTKLEDDLGRLHNDIDPAAIRFNGIEEYWIHGVNVPEKWIKHKEKISSDDFLNETNVERRRVLMEIIGKDRFVDVLKMKKLNDTFRQGILYELFEKVDQVYGKIHIVRCTSPPEKDKDSKSYYLMTPPWLSDVWGSVAWTFYETASSYSPEVET